jgi:acyl-CoA dehydrogenase
VIVVPRPTATQGAKGTSLLVVETDRAASAGLRARSQPRQDRHEGAGHLGAVLRRRAVPAENLLGGAEGQGFFQLMQQLPQERLIIAVRAWVRWSARSTRHLAYVKERKAFGKP